MKKKKIDILDFLPEEGMKAFDKLGYDFLAANGYNVEGAIESEKRRFEIKKELEKNGETLFYRGAVDKETQNILVWYELKAKAGTIKRSNGIKFMPRKVEEGKDEERRKSP